MNIDLAENSKFYIKSKDYALTKEEFELCYNLDFDLLITQPIPENSDKYYESSEYISHTDSNKTFFDKIYQIAKKYAVKKKLKLINSLNSDNRKLLDIGCGTGDFLVSCKKNNWITTGVEPNEKAGNISSTKKLSIKKSIDELTGESYDVITMWHVLEHMPNLIKNIQQIKKLLKKKGTLITAAPNYKSYDAEYYREYWAAYDVPRHLWHFSKKSMEKLFYEVDMEVIDTIPMKLDSYYVSLLSEKYKNGKTNFLKAFIMGLISNWKAGKTKEYSSHIYIIKNTKH